MKNMVKLFGIIAIAAIIGFSMAACDGGGDSGGDGGGGTESTFTLTDLPAEYNGKYVLFFGGGVYGYISGGPRAYTGPVTPLVLSRVSNGMVTTPLWTGPEGDKYTGNDTIDTFWAAFYETDTLATLNDMNTLQLPMGFGLKVTFSNGTARMSFNDR